MIRAIFSFAISFFCGSLMFSFWLGKSLGKDIRRVRDGNPGAYNLFKEAGWIFGFIGGALDFFKGFLPLFFFKSSGIIQSDLILSISAGFAVLGHAFSPFLNFKGGKALAVSFGCWSALTSWEALLVLGSVLALLSVGRFLGKEPSPEEDSLKVLIAFLALVPYILLKNKSLIIFWLINSLLVVYKHKNELKYILKGKGAKNGYETGN